MSDLANQEVGARIATEADCYLLHEYGMFYDEITASSLVKTDHHGQPVGSEKRRMNDGGQNLSKWIFGAREDVNYFVHGHCEDVMAVSSTNFGLLPVTQAAVYLGHLIGYLDYTFEENEAFGDLYMALAAKHDILISHNHGYYCFGRTAREAFFRAYYLRQACEVQSKALAMSGGDVDKLRLISDERESDYRDSMYRSEDYHYDGKTEWDGLLRWLDRHAPDYKD